MSLPLTTIAIADHKPERVHLLQRMTSLWGYACSGVATTGLETLALVQLYKPNILLLDPQLCEKNTISILEKVISFKTTAVIMTVSDANSDLGQQALDAGAAGFLLQPFDASQVRSVLQTAWHCYQTEALLHAEVATLKDGLETRKLIDRAKGILIAERGVSEPEAYRLLQKMSQDKRVSIKDVCKAVDQIRLVVGSKTKNKTTP